MDSSVPTTISSTSNQLYFKGPYLHQNWSLPDSIIYYLAKNPKSSKCYQKLIQSCKYFFFKNPIIVCSELIFYGRDQTSKIVIRNNGKTKLIDLKNISRNLWNTNEILINAEENLMSSLIANIYQCDIKELNLTHQTVSINELFSLTSKADQIILCECVVKNEDGSVVVVEKIIETLTQVKKFCFYFKNNDSSVSSKTVENLLKISHFSNIDRILFRQISEVFDIETFYDYIKKNKHTFFYVSFNDSISDAYGDRLHEIVDEIIETENHDYRPPMMDFDELRNDKFIKLDRISYAYGN